MLLNKNTVLPGGFRIAATLSELQNAGSTDGVVIGQFAWLRDQERLYVCRSVDSAATSTWTVATGLVTDTSGTGTGDIKSDGSVPFTGNVDIGGNRIINLANPIDPTDGANKQYVDAANAGDIKADGSVTFTGDVNLGGNQLVDVGEPVNGSDAATKNYVDTRGFVKADGTVPFAADESMGNHKLTNVADPVVATDAATKNYVDTRGFVKADGTVPFAADESMGNHKLTNVADPVAATDAATKNYVDTRGFIRADGLIPFAADESMGGHKLTNLGAPVAASDAATKAYVDGAIGGVTGVYRFAEVTTTVTQSSGSLDTAPVYMTLDAGVLPAGTYRFGIVYVWQNELGGSISIRVTRTTGTGGSAVTTNVFGDYKERDEETDDPEVHVSHNFTQQVLTADTHKFELRFRAGGFSSVAILRARMELQKVL